MESFVLIALIVALRSYGLLGLTDLAADISIFKSGMPPMVTAGALAIATGMVPELAAALVSLGMALAFVTLHLLYLLLTFW